MSSEMKDPAFHARLIQIIGSEMKPFAWAAEMGINKATFSRIWNEGTIPGPEHLKRIREKTGYSIDWLLTGEGDEKRRGTEVSGQGEISVQQTRPLLEEGYVQVPRYEIAASAGGGAVVRSEQIVDYMAFRPEYIRDILKMHPEALALINVTGDSMEPTLFEEDLIMIDLGIYQVDSDAIYVLSIDNHLFIKRVQRNWIDGSLTVKSDNPRYEHATFRGEDINRLRVVGRLVRRIVK